MDPPSTSEFIRIIGRDRSQYEATEVHAAEQRLLELAESETERVEKNISHYGRVTAVIGFVMGIWPLVLIPIMVNDLSGHVFHLPTSGILFFASFGCVACLQVYCGFQLWIGGLRFSRREERGRMAILRVIKIGIGYCIVFSVLWELSVLIFFPWEPFKFVMLVFGPFSMWFWLYVLSFPQSYFSSATVVQICQHAGRIKSE